MSKFKNILKPDWKAIIQGVYSNIAYWLLGLVIILICGLTTRFDPLGLKEVLIPIFAIIIYILTALGAGLVLYLPINAVYNYSKAQKRKSVSARELNAYLADKLHVCSFCGYSFSTMPRPIENGYDYYIKEAICPKCGNQYQINKFYTTDEFETKAATEHAAPFDRKMRRGKEKKPSGGLDAEC